MFKLIVLLFAVTNGGVADEPTAQIKNKKKFETEKICMDYLNTEQGAKARLVIEKFIDDKKGTLAAKFICVQDGAKEDDSI